MMRDSNLKIQVAMMMLVCCSSLMLGISIGDTMLVITSILLAVSAFFLVDRLRWIELSGWVANIVSIGVLIFTMKDFIGTGSAGKLVAVAYLLTYLLTVLMFQQKTPRLCWQLLILSVLQTSLAAIFNLNFENGYIFIIYFVIAMIAMIFQNDFYQLFRVKTTNQVNIENARRHMVNAPALVQSSIPQGHYLRPRMYVVAPWLAGCLAFSFILFHSLPHTRQQNESAMIRNFTATGLSWQTDLNPSGIVQISNKLMFRARFLDFDSNEEVLLNNQPYFRGMALSKLILKDGTTNWQAPYDHVFDFSYNNLDEFSATDNRMLVGARRIAADIIAEPTNDPLLVTPMPVYRKMDQDQLFEFDRDLSALTRRRARKSNQLTSFHYRLTTLVDSANRTLEAWPYRSRVLRRPDIPMEDDSPEHQMLTKIDLDRYPRLVQAARRVAEQTEHSGRIALCKAMVNTLSQSNGFSYTLDYRNIEKDTSIDPIEDFFANYRSGHCSMFASTLVLMLRSVNVPARYVVGYHGGSYNKLTNCYVIHGRNAHAWVEVYLPPEECTEEMFAQGMARDGGSWLTLEATPAVNIENSSEALDLARSIWQDYVISPDGNKQAYNGPGPLQPGSMANSKFSEWIDWAIRTTKANRGVQALLIVAMVFIALLIAIREVAPRSRGQQNSNGFRPVRRMFGRVISVVAPGLGHRIQFGESPRMEVKFYRRLEKLLKQHLGVERQKNQTHLEFASEANQLLLTLSPPDTGPGKMSALVDRVTSAYYQIRFGSIPLDKNAIADIENELQKFEQVLKSVVRKT